MEQAAWAVLSALGHEDRLKFIVGALFLMFLFFEARRR